MINITDIYQIVWKNLEKVSCDCFDYVPYGLTDFPYVYMGGLYTRDNDTKNTDGLSCELYINIISAYRGRKEVLELMDEVNKLMENDMSTKKYSIFARQGRHVVELKKDEVGWGKNDNNAFYHAVLIFDIEIHEIK